MIRKILIAALFVLPVAVLFPGINQFTYQAGSQYSDIAISHYPNALYLQRSITTYGQVPLWSPGILSGYPFAANPLSGLFYLPGWLALPFHLPLGFNLLVIAHLIFGGVGMYLLLRAEGLDEGPALLGGLLFEAYPKLFAHFGAGHLTLLYAVPWTPWLLYAQNRAAGCLKPAGQLALPRLLPGLIMGTIVLADVRWAAYAGLVWFAYNLRPVVMPRVTPERAWQQVIQVGTWILVNVGLAAIIAAPLLLPLMEYSTLSTRSLMTAADNLTQSLNPGQLFGLIFPYLRAPAEWTLYPGAVTSVLFFLALLVSPVRRRACFWIGLTITAIIISLGSYLGPFSVLSSLPGMNLLRVPPRFLFLAGMGFAATAAYMLNYLVFTWREEKSGPGRKSWTNLGLFALWAFVVLIGGGVGFSASSPVLRLQFFWGTILFSASAAIIFFALARLLRPGILVAVLTVLGMGELAAVNSLGLAFRDFTTVMSEGAGPASYLATRVESGPFRIYSPSYSLPQQVAGLYALELADGVDPLQLAAYADYMKKASGVPSPGYSVTLPPFANADPATDNRGFLPDAKRLALLNVRFVVAEYSLSGSQLRLLARFGETRIYENPFALPRAWVQNAESPSGENIIATPQVMVEPNRVTIQSAPGPGLLVLSELAYSGWDVKVDGEKALIETIEGLFRGVRLASGTHQVEFEFRPMRVVIGLALAAIAWLSVLIVAATAGMRRGLTT